MSDVNFNYLRLIRSNSIGPKTFYKLLNQFGSIEHVLHNSHSLIPEKEIEQEIQSCKKLGAKIISINDKEYPETLKQISDPPPILTCLGNIELLNTNCFAIVGARNASANSYSYAQKLAQELGQNNLTIVSGLARGIDSAAHQGSINTGTIAVLGTGINTIYPEENEQLYHEIAKKGLIISEFPFSTQPQPQNFPIRNRIVSGLSQGILVVEAGFKSGTLITAKQALDQNKDIFVVPGAPYDPRCKGSNQLIKDGAIMVTKNEDILNELNLEKTNKPQIQTQLFEQQKTQKTLKPKSEPKNLKGKILDKLNSTPISISTLTDQLQIPSSKLDIILSELELEGKIIIEYGQIRSA